MSVSTLNVVTLESASEYLRADYGLLYELAVDGRVECSCIKGEFVVDEEQLGYLERVVEVNSLTTKGRQLISLEKVLKHCYNKGYIKDDSHFYFLEQNGYFKEYKVKRPFSGEEFYRRQILTDLDKAIRRGALETIKDKGYTETSLMTKMEITSDKLKNLVGKLKINPLFVNGILIYTKSQSEAIEKLHEMDSVRGKTKVTRTEDVVFYFEGLEYVNKENIGLYTGLKYKRLYNLNSLSVIPYQEIEYKGVKITVALKRDLDLLMVCLKKGYKPKVIAIILRGIVDDIDLDQYMTRVDFKKYMLQLGLSSNRADYLLRRIIDPDIKISYLELYKNKQVMCLVKRLIRDTCTQGLTDDHISIAKLTEITGQTQYMLKRDLKKHFEVIEIVGVGSFVKLSDYLSIQTEDVITGQLVKEYKQYKNLLNIDHL